MQWWSRELVRSARCRQAAHLAAKALPALRLLLSGTPVGLAQAADETGVDVEQLADILIEEELCAELTPELSSGFTGLVTTANS